MKAFVLINLKVYRESSGQNAFDVALAIDSVRRNGYELAIAPSLLTTKEVIRETSLPVYAQYAEANGFGAYTGSVGLDELKAIGVSGIILNHSEKRLSLYQICRMVGFCHKRGLKTVVCTTSVFKAKRIVQYNPTYLAYEPKELIGGDTSVTRSRPEVLVKLVNAIRNIKPHQKILCGAGIISGEDVGKALMLGTNGVLIAHAIARAKNPKQALQGMLL